MLSKKQIKFISSLKFKKFREKHGLFIAEGVKIAEDLFKSSITVKQVFATDEFIQNMNISSRIPKSKFTEISEHELKRASALTTPNKVICIAEIPNYSLDIKSLQSQLTLVLDNLSDPGNLGTIIRTADWFGIQNIICSENCVDVYNPKVVQATMGSISRVKVHYLNLVNFLKETGGTVPIYGAVLNGEDIYQKKLSKNGLIILGNETEGISDAIELYVTDKISIPSFGGAESLNVAVATAIVCSEFRKSLQ